MARQNIFAYVRVSTAGLSEGLRARWPASSSSTCSPAISCSTDEHSVHPGDRGRSPRQQHLPPRCRRTAISTRGCGAGCARARRPRPGHQQGPGSAEHQRDVARPRPEQRVERQPHGKRRRTHSGDVSGGEGGLAVEAAPPLELVRHLCWCLSADGLADRSSLSVVSDDRDAEPASIRRSLVGGAFVVASTAARRDLVSNC